MFMPKSIIDSIKKILFLMSVKINLEYWL